MGKPEVIMLRQNSLRRREEKIFRGTNFEREPILFWVILNSGILVSMITAVLGFKLTVSR